MEEGYIKYHLEWEYDAPLPDAEIEALNSWRKRMYDLGLIGHYDDLGVGYGNISQRCTPLRGDFVISGTQTGHLSELTAAHYTVVTDYDIPGNALWCRGPIRASSESLTHAAVYALSPIYQAVIHIHHRGLWERLLDKIPTTSPAVPYGTPEMAHEVLRLFRETDMVVGKVFVMAGHEEGIVAFGESLDEAGQVIERMFGSG